MAELKLVLAALANLSLLSAGDDLCRGGLLLVSVQAAGWYPGSLHTRAARDTTDSLQIGRACPVSAHAHNMVLPKTWLHAVYQAPST